MDFRLLDFGLYQIYKTMGFCGINYDVNETDKEITFSMGVPGMTREDIEIKIRDGKRLLVKSLKANKYTPDFYYAFVLPTSITHDGSYASVENGVLTITMEKKEQKEYKIKLR